MATDCFPEWCVVLRACYIAYLQVMEVELREVTDDVLEELRASVVLPPEQAHYVGGSIDDVLEEAEENPEGKPWFRGVYVDDEPVGFLMLSWDVVPRPPEIHGPWFLWKLMVVPHRQREGIATAIVDHARRIVAENGGTELMTSYTEGPGDPSGFYARIGFVPTGERDADGEVLLSIPAR